MSDEKKYTERDLIMARRQAFETGVNWFFTQDSVPASMGYLLDHAGLSAERLYPLPKAMAESQRTGEDDR